MKNSPAKLSKDSSKDRYRRARLGAAAIEFACVLPFLVLFLMGSVEVGRGVMVKHVLEEAARAGCRVAVFESSTAADVNSIVGTAMDAANLSGSNYTVTIDPPNPQGLEAFQPVTVSIEMNFADVSWIPTTSFALSPPAKVLFEAISPSMTFIYEDCKRSYAPIKAS